MPPTRGRPPAIESQKIIDAILKESRNIVISKSGNIVDKNHVIWKTISKKLKNLIAPYLLYAYVTDNRYKIKKLLFDREGLSFDQSSSSINDTTVNESIQSTVDSDLSLQENVRQSYIIQLSKAEFKALIVVKHRQSKTRTAKKKFIKYKAMAPTIWEDVIFDKLVNSYKITCGLSFKNHSIAWDQRSSFFKGYCVCGGTCDGVIKNDPNDNFVEITCTIAKGDGKCGKRCLRSEKRKNVVAEIGQQTVHAYRAEKAADNMEFGDSEPPNLPSSPVLRNARYEQRRKNFIHKDPILAVQILKHNQGKFIIRDIHLDPFAVYYWSPQQLGMYKSYVAKGHSCLCIDATGGLFRPLIKYKDIRSKYIYLYHGVIRVEAGQFPVVQMISETQTSDDIHGWLTKWVTSGAPPPSEIVIDGGLALLTGAIRTFTSSSTIHEYADAGYDPIVPSCYIRMDNAHYIKTWVDLLKGMHPQIKVFYQGVIVRLIICTDRNEAKNLINSILILCQSETYGKLEDGTDSAAENAYNYLKAMITGTDLSEIDFEAAEKAIEAGFTDIDFDDDDLEGNDNENDKNKQVKKRKKITNRWSEWGDEANDKVILLKKTQTEDRANAHYNPGIAKKLLKDLPSLSLWSCVIRNDFGFDRIPATSAPVESDFNLVKNSYLKGLVLSIRVDEFLIKYLKLLDGKLKLTEARIQELDKEDQNHQKQISDESEDESLDLCGLPIAMSSNGTKCPACLREDNPPEGNECFICQKPIHNLDDCSISLSPEYGLGQQRICLLCNDLENLDTILASKLEENWGGKTVKTRATVNGPTVKITTSVLKDTGTTKPASRVSKKVESSDDDDSDNEKQALPENIYDISDMGFEDINGTTAEFTSCPACIRNDKPSGIHKCISCFTPIHNLDACSIPLTDKEGFGQQRICLACNKLGKTEVVIESRHKKPSNIMETPKTNNNPLIRKVATLNNKKTKLTSTYDNTDKKTAKYLGQKPALISEQISFQTWKPTNLTLLKNGSHETLAATKIDNKEVYAIKTCAFDSFYQIITAAINDWDNFRIKVKGLNNMMYTLAAEILEKKTTFAKLYADRARFHYDFIKSVEQPDGSLLINCEISIVQIVLRVFKNTPSCRISIQCHECGQQDQNDVIIPVLYMADIENGSLNLENLSNLTMTSQCQHENCTGIRKTSIIALGEMVLFEIYNADEDQNVKLNKLPTSFHNPVKKIENYRLVGAVDLINEGPRRRSCEFDDLHSEIGHFRAMCLRGTQWWEYNDALDKPKKKRANSH